MLAFIEATICLVITGWQALKQDKLRLLAAPPLGCGLPRGLDGFQLHSRQSLAGPRRGWRRCEPALEAAGEHVHAKNTLARRWAEASACSGRS